MTCRSYNGYQQNNSHNGPWNKKSGCELLIYLNIKTYEEMTTFEFYKLEKKLKKSPHKEPLGHKHEDATIMWNSDSLLSNLILHKTKL